MQLAGSYALLACLCELLCQLVLYSSSIPCPSKFLTMVSVVADPLGECTVEAQLHSAGGLGLPCTAVGRMGYSLQAANMGRSECFCFRSWGLGGTEAPMPITPKWQSCALHPPVPWDLLTSHLETRKVSSWGIPSQGRNRPSCVCICISTADLMGAYTTEASYFRFIKTSP